uniref:Uncharacterized protein n=1 Tax=Oryza brachyantha TaxID=4533 RepID=J3MWC4_ORYBR
MGKGSLTSGLAGKGGGREELGRQTWRPARKPAELSGKPVAPRTRATREPNTHIQCDGRTPATRARRCGKQRFFETNMSLASIARKKEEKEQTDSRWRKKLGFGEQSPAIDASAAGSGRGREACSGRGGRACASACSVQRWRAAAGAALQHQQQQQQRAGTARILKPIKEPLVQCRMGVSLGPLEIHHGVGSKPAAARAKPSPTKLNAIREESRPSKQFAIPAKPWPSSNTKQTLAPSKDQQQVEQRRGARAPGPGGNPFARLLTQGEATRWSPSSSPKKKYSLSYKPFSHTTNIDVAKRVATPLSVVTPLTLA